VQSQRQSRRRGGTITIFDNRKNFRFSTYWHARGYAWFCGQSAGQKILQQRKRRMNFSIPPHQIRHIPLPNPDLFEIRVRKTEANYKEFRERNFGRFWTLTRRSKIHFLVKGRRRREIPFLRRDVPSLGEGKLHMFAIAPPDSWTTVIGATEDSPRFPQ